MMQVTQDLIEEIVAEVAGQEGIDIVNYLKKTGGDTDEFEISDHTDYEVKRIRQLLYKLNEYNIVTYRRRKDKERGWSVSYWTFHPRQIKEVTHQLYEERLDSLKERLAREETFQDNFFMCPNMCARMDFETAFDFNFHCPECGKLLKQQENQRTIEHLKKQIAELEEKVSAARA